jgi:predicted DNA-binding WGR domain protein
MYTSQLWVHSAKRRYYRASVHQDLLGHWVMVRDWGSLDTKLGGTKTELLEGFGQGKAQLEAVSKRRASHRYVLVETDGVGLGAC